MINFVLNKFVKKLNSVSLSPYERAVLRKDFLARTGLGDFAKRPSLESSFVLTPHNNGNLNFDLKLVDGYLKEKAGSVQKEEKINHLEQEISLRVNLDTPFTDRNFVIMKVAPAKKI